MAHNLAKTNGKVAMFSVKEIPWHGLGIVLENAPNSEEAIIHAGLNYNVALAPLVADIDNQIIYDDTDIKGNITTRRRDIDVCDGANLLSVPNRFASYRTDDNTVFGTVGSRYEIVQNVEAFTFFDNVVGIGEAVYETAGALDGGATVFITAKLPSHITINGNDIIDKYLLLYTTHDGKSSIQAMLTPVRVVCNNTLQMALKNNTNKISIRHTRKAQDRLEQGGRVMGLVNQQSDLLQEALNILATSERGKINDTQFSQYLDYVFLTKEELKLLALNGAERSDVISTRKSNIITEVAEYYHTVVVDEFDHCAGTLYGAYNAVTGYYQNRKSHKNSENKFSSNLIGANYDTMQDALATALQVSYGSLVLNN